MAATACETGLVRVLLVVSGLEYGGAERQVVELANHMDRRRFETHICSLSEYVPLAAKLVDRQRRLHIIQKRSPFDWTVITRLAHLLRDLKVHVVHGFLGDAEIAVRLAGRWAGTSLIVGSERNSDCEYRIKKRARVASWLTRGSVDLVIANSHAGAAFNQRVFGLPSAKYRVVHNGVDVESFRPRDSGEIRRELGIVSSDRLFGMFASYKKQKNHPLLFAAARTVFDRVPNARLLLVGDEPFAGKHGADKYKRDMIRLVDELRIRPRCIFAGNRDDVAELYCACDTTVLSSFHEGTPNVLLESMACEVPVVATDVSDNAYIVPDGKVGFIVPLGSPDILADRISRLLSDDDLRRTMGRQARAWVAQEFSCTQLARKTEDLYTKALDDHCRA